MQPQPSLDLQHTCNAAMCLHRHQPYVASDIATIIGMSQRHKSCTANEDADDIRAFRRGSMDAFHRLYTRHERRLLFYIRSMLRQTDVAEDVFQDTWLHVLEKLPDFRFQGAFRNWLYTIAHHKVIDHLRAMNRRATISLDEPRGDDGTVTLQELLADPAPDLYTSLSIQQLYEKLRALVETLPPAQREVFLLRTDAGMTFNEIAALVDAPLNTVLGRMHYAVVRLRAALKEEYDSLK